MNPGVSIIVPVYNTPKEYLNRCLEAIRKQSFSHYELILVDDGSREDTAKYLDNWAARDNRIRTFHRPNGGVSNARNFGLSQASGKYIMFVDSDDVVSADWLNWAVEAAEKHSVDVVFGQVKGISSAGEINQINSQVTGRYRIIDEKQIWKIRCGQMICKMKDSEPIFEVSYFGNWGKLFRRNILRHLQFDEECYYGEDQLFNHQVLQKVRSALWSFDIGYFLFLDREESATNRYDPKRKDAIKRYVTKCGNLFCDDMRVQQAFYLHVLKLSENEVFHMLKTRGCRNCSFIKLNAILKDTLRDPVFADAVSRADVRLLKISAMWLRLRLIQKRWTVPLILWDMWAMMRREKNISVMVEKEIQNEKENG